MYLYDGIRIYITVRLSASAEQSWLVSPAFPLTVTMLPAALPMVRRR